MKLVVQCEKCNNFVELIPTKFGQHANFSSIESRFKASEIQIEFDHDADSAEEVTPVLEEIRIDCNSCGDYIVLNEFPSHVYRYR
ncbi:hypothetical protein [Fictibacillus sp. S7]|uniref:hypothetical protein n=1 Tax=Fictibacillus sp. S7 TaxID=2212476 RepID=UPI001011A828|nr:hypothetical protein [Fictibacillus sp. S7]RXZ00849.1 hypothetical protein DMO16_14890 [Fictibacillus sp. S7]